MVSCLSRLACVTQRQKDVLSYHSKPTDSSLLHLFRACSPEEEEERTPELLYKKSRGISIAKCK